MNDTSDHTIKEIHARLRAEFGTSGRDAEPTHRRGSESPQVSIKDVHARLLGDDRRSDGGISDRDDACDAPESVPPGALAKVPTWLPVPALRQAVGKWTSVAQKIDGRHDRVANVVPDRGPNIAFFRTGLAGVIVVALTFVGFGGWAATAPLASAVVAEGVLKIASERKAIQHIDGGVVRGILVRDGDVVRKGDPLIRLDDVTVRATLDSLRIRHDAARARKARLESEKFGRDDVEYPADLVERGRADKEISDLMENELAIFATRRDILNGEISILTEKIAQLEEQIEATQAQLTANKKQLSHARELLGGLNKLSAKGLVEKPRLIKLKREIAELEGQAGLNVAEKARFGKEISETRLQIVQRRNSLQEKVVAELREVDDEIAEINAKMRDIDHTVRNSVITAPEGGVVMGLAVHAAGEVIQPGATILELIPEGEPLLVEARVAPRDVEDLRSGQKAQVRLTAFRQRTTPSVDGRLVYVSADRFTDERTQQSYYIARVQFMPGTLDVLGARELQPGMPAEVIIESGERTALAYLAQPILDGLSQSWREK